MNSDLPELDLGVEGDIQKVDCEFVDQGSFKNRLSNYNSNKSFSILNYNIRSCRRNFPLFITYLSQLIFKFSVIVLTESWLSSAIDQGFDIPQYKQLNLYRDSHGGGIKVLYSDVFSAHIIDHLTYVSDHMEVLAFWLIGGTFKFLFCCLYRPPSVNKTEFNDVFIQYLLNLPNAANVFIVGDTNMNLFNPQKIFSIDLFMTNLLSLGFLPLITLPTKINLGNSITKFSLIDQIWSNYLDGSEQKSFIVEFPLTDHFPVCHVFNQSVINSLRSVKFRLINENRKLTFISKINNLDLTDIYQIHDPGIAFSCFYNRIFDVFNSCFPIKTKVIRNEIINAPWCTHKLKLCLKKKFELYNLKKRGLITNRIFNVYKRTLLYVTNKMRRLYYSKKFNKSFNNPRKNWNNINQILNRKKNNTINEILVDGHSYTGNLLPDVFNFHFTNVVSSLISNLPPMINYDFFSDLSSVSYSCFLIPCSNEEINSTLKTLGNKGNILYDIPSKFICLISDQVVPILVYIFNMCLEVGVYPDFLKTARVIPLYKAGAHTDLNNYRPISTLLSFNKLFERLIYNRLSCFLEQSGILFKNQFGFRQNKNTTLAIFNLLSDFFNTFNKKLYTIALFLDIKKAFDSVDKNILLMKLNKYGVRGISNKLIDSYLSNRKQYVSLEDSWSSTLGLNKGVPQGSVLGPLLFNVFIDDITSISNCKSILYADDSVFYVTDTTFGGCVDKLRQVIEDLSLWLVNNKLIPNAMKTKLMLITPKYTPELPDIEFNNTILEWVDNFKYLGFNIDSKLSFSFHADFVNKQLSRLLGVMYSVAKLIPRKTLKMIYQSMILPVLCHNIVIWGGISQVHLNSIIVKINKILRLILHVKYSENRIPLVSTSSMFKELNLLQFRDLYHFSLLKFLHHILYIEKNTFIEHFVPLLPNHSYNTRNTKINLPVTRLSVEKNFTTFNLCKFINEIPESFIEQQSKRSLKRVFYSSTIGNY